MNGSRMLAWGSALALAMAPISASAQNVSTIRSDQPDLPYSLFYPAEMVASGGGDAPLTINHSSAPLQCELTVVPVEDTTWTAESALNDFDQDAAAAAWAADLTGFAITETGTREYRDVTALSYEGTSTNSPLGEPLTLRHTEAVTDGRGYILDCFFAAAQAEQARPLVDFIIANFSTRADADCCVDVESAPLDPSSTPQ